MSKKDNLEAKVTQDEKNYKQKLLSKLMKQQKNGISPWKSREEITKKLRTNEGDQQGVDESTEVHFFPQEASKSQQLSSEDSAEDFSLELDLYNDLVVTSELMSCNEYVPYYRTHTSLVEAPVCVNAEVQQENTEAKEGSQSNGWLFQPKYEDESLSDMGFASGYFPYYRTCEEYLGSWDPASEVRSRAKSEASKTSSDDEIESDIESEIEEECEDRVFQETCETNEDTHHCLETLEAVDTHGSIDSIMERCTSETSLCDDILSLDPLPSSSGYFPYYRTYGKLLLSPVDPTSVFCSSEDTLGGFGMDRKWTGEGSRDSGNGCALYRYPLESKSQPWL